jgi:hypothetical protein
MSTVGELWHIVEAKRDDGTPTMFRIRELDPQRHLTTIFVVEMPYPATELSRLPSASAYRRLADFDEQWLRPACTQLGWELVGSKTEDGSFFLYMYGAGDPNAMIARLSPFDSNLGFYDDADPGWLEYGTLRELLDQAKAIPLLENELGAMPTLEIAPSGEMTAAPSAAPPPAKQAATPKPATPKPAKAKPANAKTKAKPAKAKAKAKPAKAKAKPAKAKAKPKAKPAKPKPKAKPAKPKPNARKKTR